MEVLMTFNLIIIWKEGNLILLQEIKPTLKLSLDKQFLDIVNPIHNIEESSR